MTTFTVIPYLLGIVMTPNRTIDEGLLEYTFQVDAHWWVYNFDHLGEHVKLSVELKCHPAGFDMLCRLEEYKVQQELKGRDSVLPGVMSYINKTTDEEALKNESRPFQIKFNERGVVGYFVEGDAIPKRMINLYRIIGNQLNIGVDMKKKEETFEDVEQSNVGFCLVRCTKITQDLFQGPIANLTSFVGCDIANSMTIIYKRKNSSQCGVLSRYSVTTSLWPDLFPKTVTSYVLAKSESAIGMSSQKLESLTENVFSLYDEKNKIVGDLAEKVELYLKSYRLLPPDSLITLNKDKIDFHEAANDETA